MARSVHLLVVLLCLASGFPAVSGSSTDESAPNPPGQLVDVGGYRLHLHVLGEGSPTVVLLPGAGDFSFDWVLVQSEVAKTVRTVSYDRAGSAWSDPGPTPRSMKQEAHELRLALANSGLRPPYVLVGHSVGGLVARVYARNYPTEVAGVVLVDATHENTVLSINGKLARVRELAQERAVPDVQTLRTSPPKPPTKEDLEQVDFNRQMFGPPKIESPFSQLPAELQRVRLWFLNHPKLSAAADDYWSEELRDLHRSRQSHPRELGDRPLISIAGAKEWDAQGTDEEQRRVRAEKKTQKEDLAALSSRGRFIAVPQAGHHLQLDAPTAVIAAIRDVVTAVKAGSK
ncbi:MAG: alpha/beta hydrolase [Opitutae bacterium]|nr:alpha/beta hydrolase [Opitutae bacterium]